jgi:Mg2+/Co2+ transporter CorB
MIRESSRLRSGLILHGVQSLPNYQHSNAIVREKITILYHIKFVYQTLRVGRSQQLP